MYISTMTIKLKETTTEDRFLLVTYKLLFLVTEKKTIFLLLIVL